jgi:hypothetical protein
MNRLLTILLLLGATAHGQINNPPTSVNIVDATATGRAVLTATNAAAAATAVGLGAANSVTFSNVTANGNIFIGSEAPYLRSDSGSGSVGFYNSINDEYILSIPNDTDPVVINSQWNDAGVRSNLGLGTTNSVTFQSLVADQLQVLIGTNLYVSLAEDVSEFFVPLQLEDELAVVGAATFSTNVTVNGNLSVGSLTTTTPSTWALDATQTAADINGILDLPSNANVLRITNANTISGVSNGVLGAFYFLVNESGTDVVISNSATITARGATNITLGANESATLISTTATNASAH